MGVQVDDPNITAGLILWANIQKYPNTFSKAAISFIEDILVKDPAKRPSAVDLMAHPWLEAMEELKIERKRSSSSSIIKLVR